MKMFRLIVCSVLAPLCSACNHSADFRPALLQIDSLSNAWKMEWEGEKLWSTDSLNTEKFEAMKSISSIDKMSNRMISISNAQSISNLRSDCDALSEAVVWIESVVAYHDGELKRLDELRKAFQEHPQTDVNGAVIDDRYLDRAIDEQVSRHLNFRSQVMRSRSKVDSVYRRFTTNKIAVDHILDSLHHPQQQHP